MERSKEILPTTSMEVSQRRKKAVEPLLKRTNKQSREFNYYYWGNLQTNYTKSVKFKFYNNYWGTLHSIVERSKEILLTMSMEVSQRRKKVLEPPLKQTKQQRNI